MDARVIEEMIKALRRLDNRFGGGSTRGVVLGYLNNEVSPILRVIQAQGTASRRLMQVVAELTQLAGWVSHDVGENNLARWYFGESLRLARAAGDTPFACEVLAGMSHQAAYIRDDRTAKQQKTQDFAPAGNLRRQALPQYRRHDPFPYAAWTDFGTGPVASSLRTRRLMPWLRLHLPVTPSVPRPSPADRC